MIRLFFALLTLVMFIYIMDANAQIKPAQSQYLEERGFLINPGFEQGYKGWTISGCTKSLVSDVPLLNKSLKLTCVNEPFSIKQETTTATALKGQQGVFDIQIKTTVDGARVSGLTAGLRGSELIVQASTTYRRLSDIPMVLSTVSNGLEVYSDANFSGEIIIDNIKVGLAPAGFLNTDYDDVPIGTILSYGSETLPDGYLLADGACIKKGDYASLNSVIGGPDCTIDTANDGFNLPDLRNQFLRGLTSGRSVFDSQADATAKNGLSANTVGNQGDHSHRALQTTGGGTALQQGSGAFNGNLLYINGYNTETAGAHGHTLAVTSTDSETRPANKSVVYIIKAKGRSPITVVSQKTMSPDKAGFIIWGAFDSLIEGHKKANGDCIKRADFPDYFANVGTTFGSCTIDVADDGVRLPNLVDSNRYIRSAGGSLAVGQLQDDATAKNGLTASSGNQTANHNHSYYSSSLSTGSGAPNRALVDAENTANATHTTSTNQQNHQHVITIGAGDSETRPISMALIPYVRVVDRDEIKGSFEQIKSSELYYGEFSVGSQNLNNGNTTMAYSTTDNGNGNGAYNTTTGIFTAEKDGNYTFCPKILYDEFAWGIGNVGEMQLVTSLKSFVLDRFEVTTTNTDYFALGKCQETFLNAGNTARVVVSQNNGVPLNTIASESFNTLTISELPTTESIIKNLNDNNNIECTTKFLTSDISANTVSIADLLFTMEIGSKYDLTYQTQFFFGTTGDSRFILDALMGGVSVARAMARVNRDGGTNEEFSFSTSAKCLKATATSLVFEAFGEVGTAEIKGNGTRTDTYATLCKLPDNAICN